MATMARLKKCLGSITNFSVAPSKKIYIFLRLLRTPCRLIMVQVNIWKNFSSFLLVKSSLTLLPIGGGFANFKPACLING
jgi:hypothetical protein